jgi:acyl-CoA synthetase (AMP-forming)/AMP-acid ligase II
MGSDDHHLGDVLNAIETIVSRMRENADAPAVVWNGAEITYDSLLRLIEAWESRLRGIGVGPGTVCAIVSDYSPETVALFFALMRRRSIMVPLLRDAQEPIDRFLDIAGVEVVIRIDDEDGWDSEPRHNAVTNVLVAEFRDVRAPGLIVFTSGSTGAPKGILHDAERVMRKFVRPRQGWRMVLFLMMDHFGGINSLLSTIANGGTGICIPNRAPDTVCALIESTKATLLPTTPTFLSLLVASGSHRRADLSSIQLITYGTEVMTEVTLKQVRTAFPSADLKQTYGLSELGVLRSKSESKDSTWVRIGGDGFEVRVLDDVLWIRSEANMFGYLNAPNPFDGEGWLCTGDKVEVRGDYYRILGRESDLIFVGGEKVYPAEIETVLQEDSNVREATVFGVKHPMMGSIAHANLSLHEPEDAAALTARLRRLCVSRLARFKVPVRFTIVSNEEMRSTRFKKLRPMGVQP